MTLSLDLLSANLIELKAWAQSSEASQHERPVELLVPNKAGTRLYHRGHLMGRLWGLYWSISRLGNSRDPVPLQLELTFEKVVLAFKEHQLNSHRDNDLYLDQLLNIPGIEPLSEDEKIQLKGRIFQTYYSLNPFWKLRKNALSEKVKDRIDRIFSAALPKRKLLSQKLIQLESLTGQLFPLSIVQKAAKGEKLSRLERITLKTYCERLKVWKFSFCSAPDNEIPKYKVTVRFLHRVLKQLVELINSKHPEMDLNLPLFEAKLCTLGLRIFETADSDHIRWRRSLPGTELSIGGQTISVGQQIGAKENDKYAVFEIKDKPGVLLRTAYNEAALLIDYIIIQRSQYGIPYVNYLQIGENGLYTIVERVTSTVDDIARKYVERPSDVEVLLPIRDLIEELNKLKDTPDPLNIQEIGFIPSGELRTYRWIKASPSNPPAIEKFVTDCAKGNPNFRSLLMRGSRMATQENIKYYESVVENATQGSILPVFMARVKHLEFNDNLKEKGEALFERIKFVKNECREELLLNYTVKDRKQLDDMINYCIKLYHRKNSLGSQVPRNFKEIICTEVVQLLKLQQKR